MECISTSYWQYRRPGSAVGLASPCRNTCIVEFIFEDAKNDATFISEGAKHAIDNITEPHNNCCVTMIRGKLSPSLVTAHGPKLEPICVPLVIDLGSN